MLAGALVVPSVPLVFAARVVRPACARRRGRRRSRPRPRPAGSRSTACCSATAPTRRGAGPSRASRRASRSCGCVGGAARGRVLPAAAAAASSSSRSCCCSRGSPTSAPCRPAPTTCAADAQRRSASAVPPRVRNQAEIRDNGGPPGAARVERADAIEIRAITETSCRRCSRSTGAASARRRARPSGPTAGRRAELDRTRCAFERRRDGRLHAHVLVRADDAGRRAAFPPPPCRRSRCSRRIAAGACSRR